MTNLFVSWSGERGERLAGVLARVLQESFDTLGQDLSVTFSSTALQVGGDWRSQLHAHLAQADFGVALLEPAALHSPWVAFEAGFLTAGGRRDQDLARLVPLLLCESLEPVKGTPFEALQCAVLSPTGFERFADGLLAAAGADTSRTRVKYLAESLHKGLAPTWQDIQSEGAQAHLALLTQLDGVLTDYARFGLTSLADSQQIRNLLAAAAIGEMEAHETSLASELSEIARLFRECLGNGDFGRLAADWALKHLIVDTHVRLREIANGRLPVRNRAPVRDFWLNSVFGQATRSVWTTNFARPGGNMGGVPDPHLLAAQAAAHRGGVEITRLFVYEPEMSEREAEQRRRVMRGQVDIGIQVLVIAKSEFETKANAKNATKRIGSNDFMIIDDAFVYLTFPDESDEIEAALLNGRQHLPQLDAARAFKLVLEGYSDEVTVENVDHFPGILT